MSEIEIKEYLQPLAEATGFLDQIKAHMSNIERNWRGQAVSLVQGDPARRKAFVRKAITLPNFSGVERNTDYDVAFRKFCAVSIEGEQFPFGSSFEECQSEFNVVSELNTQLRKEVETLEEVIAKRGNYPGLAQDIDGIKIDKTLKQINEPFEYAEGNELLIDVAARMLTSCKRFEAILKEKQVRPPVEDIDVIFSDAMHLAATKKYVKELIFTCIYNVIIDAYNEIILSEGLLDDKEAILRKMATLVNVEVELEKFSLTPYEQAKNEFVSYSLDEIADRVKHLLLYAKNEEAKQKGWLSSAAQSALSYVTWSRPATDPIVIQTLFFTNILVAINAVNQSISDKLAAYFQMNNASMLFDRFYAVSRSQELSFLPTFLITPPKSESWVTWEYASDTKFDWYIEEGGECQQGMVAVKEVLKHYADEEAQNKPLARVRHYLESALIEIKGKHIPYWSRRCELYQKLADVKAESESIGSKMRLHLSAHVNRFDKNLLNDVDDRVRPIKEFTRFMSEDNNQADAELATLENYLAELRSLQKAIVSQAKMFSQERERLVRYETSMLALKEEASELAANLFEMDKKVDAMLAALSKMENVDEFEKQRFEKELPSIVDEMKERAECIANLEKVAANLKCEDDAKARMDYDNIKSQLAGEKGNYDRLRHKFSVLEGCWNRVVNPNVAVLHDLKVYLEEKIETQYRKRGDHLTIIGKHHELLMDFFKKSSATDIEAKRCLINLIELAHSATFEKEHFVVSAYGCIFALLDQKEQSISAVVAETVDVAQQRIVGLLKDAVRKSESDILKIIKELVDHKFWDDKGAASLGLFKSAPAHIKHLRDMLVKPDVRYADVVTLANKAAQETQNKSPVVLGCYGALAGGAFATLHWIEVHKELFPANNHEKTVTPKK